MYMNRISNDVILDRDFGFKKYLIPLSSKLATRKKVKPFIFKASQIIYVGDVSPPSNLSKSLTVLISVSDITLSMQKSHMNTVRVIIVMDMAHIQIA